MRESNTETISHSGDDVFIENAAKRRDAAYKTYQQIFNTLTDFTHRRRSAIDRGHKADEPSQSADRVLHARAGFGAKMDAKTLSWAHALQNLAPSRALVSAGKTPPEASKVCSSLLAL